MSERKNVIFIRHGNTKWNTLQKFQGKTDIPLSVDGEMQADLLAKRLETYNIDIVYSSPLIRAIETAKPIVRLKGVELITVDALKEVDFGRWEGLTIDEIRESYPDEYEKCRKNPAKNGFRYGLTFEDVSNTASSFINKYILNGKYKSIAVVSHSVIIKVMLINLLGIPAECFHSLYISNCSLSIVVVDEERNVLKRLNDNAHIEMFGRLAGGAR